MAELPDLTVLQQINLDTVERAIIYAITTLKGLLTKNKPSNSNIEEIKLAINTTNEISFISSEINIPYDSYRSSIQGVNIIPNLQEVVSASKSEIIAEYTLQNSINNTLVVPFINESKIDTLEKYLIFYCFILQASLAIKNEYIEIRFFENKKDGAYVRVKLKLPFDYSAWLSGGNFPSTVKSVVENGYIVSSSNLIYTDDCCTTNNILNNQTILNNEIVLSN